MDNENRTDLRPEAELNEEGNITVHKNKTVDFIAKIICLLLAFFLWYYAASSDTVIYEEEFSSVPVEIVNKSSFAVLSGDGVTVDVTLSGNRNNIRKIKASDIRAYVDVSDITEAGRYTYDIRYELPNGVTLEKSSIGSVAVYLDNKTSKTVPVEVNVFNYNTSSGAQILKSEVADIVITGPAGIIEQIDHAELPVDLNHIFVTNSLTYRGELVLIDTNGEQVNNSYVKLSADTASVTLSVYVEREVPVVVRFRYGIQSAENCRITLSHSQILVRGESDVVSNMVIECIIDEKTLKSGSPVTCVVGLPSGVQNLDGITSVDVTVRLKNYAEKELTVPVTVSGDGKSAVGVIAPVTVKVRGESSLIAELTEADIKAYITINGAEGSKIETPVSFEFLNKFDGKVYEIYEANSPYTVGVTVGP